MLGLAKEELGDLPIRGIEDTVEALGEQRGWDRGQVMLVKYMPGSNGHFRCVFQIGRKITVENG